MIKQFNFKIWNFLNKFITKHEPPYTKQPISSSFLDQIECFLIALEVLMKGYKIYFNKKKGAMCKKWTSFEILSVWW
jgi:hypothetical protein